MQLRLLLLAAVLLWTALVGGCASVFPKSRGLTIVQPLTADSPGYATTLQIKWLGAASYSIQLGDVTLLTDPFFTRHSILKVAFGSVASNPATVRETIDGVPVAQAVFVGHSHYDHLLDLAGTLTQPKWLDVPVYGNESTRNILAGFDEDLAKCRWRPVDTTPEWHTVAPGLKYQAVGAEHAPNLKCGRVGVLLFPGTVPDPMTQPPRKAHQFKVGETFAYVFQLSNEHAGLPQDQHRTFTIYFAGAASSAPRGFPHESIETVDVAILCVPGWKNVTGYPGRFLQRLKPRVVVLSHFDNMFQERRNVRQVIMTADLGGFLRETKRCTDYPGFERIEVPDVGDLLQFRKP